jgi:hypothetical protein
VDSYFQLCERGYHHDRVDVDALAAGIAELDEDPMALCLGYYDKSLSRWLYVYTLLYMACIACDTYFVLPFLMYIMF